MPKVMVGNSQVSVSWREYYCAILPKGTLVKAQVRTALGNREWIIGTVEGSTFYDGVVLRIATLGKNYTVFPAMGDKVRRVKDHREHPYCGAYI